MPIIHFQNFVIPFCSVVGVQQTDLPNVRPILMWMQNLASAKATDLFGSITLDANCAFLTLDAIEFSLIVCCVSVAMVYFGK